MKQPLNNYQESNILTNSIENELANLTHWILIENFKNLTAENTILKEYLDLDYLTAENTRLKEHLDLDEIEIDLDEIELELDIDLDLDEKIKHLTTENMKLKENLDLDKIIKDLDEENTRLKKALDLDNEIKLLTSENMRLKEDLYETEATLNTYRYALTYLENKLSKTKAELKSYIKKDIKSKKKEINISKILEDREKLMSYRAIAKKYGVSPSTIYYRINKAQK